MQLNVTNTGRVEPPEEEDFPPEEGQVPPPPEEGQVPPEEVEVSPEEEEVPPASVPVECSFDGERGPHSLVCVTSSLS